jgi:RNA polymerase sigma-70 factor (ECF subfamily)
MIAYGARAASSRQAPRVQGMTETPPTLPILTRIAAGDAAAVKECIDTYGGLVWSLARRFCESAADAEDASQEIFLEVWKSAARYEATMGKESTFIATIARRRLIDRLRQSGRRPPTEEFDDSRAFDSEPVDDGAVAADIGAAQRALGKLKPEQREVLMLGIVEGLTHSEIALRMGKPLGTVKTHMRRGLVKLREFVDAGGDDPKGDDEKGDEQ